MKPLSTFFLACVTGFLTQQVFGQDFNGLGMGMGTLSRLSRAQTRRSVPRTSQGRKERGGWRQRGPG